MKRRETARERDERIVAHGKPWHWELGTLCPNEDYWARLTIKEEDRMMRAAARILNRLSRPKAARKGKK